MASLIIHILKVYDSRSKQLRTIHILDHPLRRQNFLNTSGLRCRLMPGMCPHVIALGKEKVWILRLFIKKLTHIFTYFRAFQDWLQISQVAKILKNIYLKCIYQTTGRESLQIFLSGKAGRTADWGAPQIPVPYMTISTTSSQRFHASIFIFPPGLQIGKYEECKDRRML